MYAKRCKNCGIEHTCDITFEPELCSICNGPLEEDKEATKILWDIQKKLVSNLTVLRDSYVYKIKTVGQLADANAKRMGKAEVEERLAANKTKRAPAGDNMSKREMELPKGSERKTMTPTKMDRSLLSATKEQIIKYVETGVKPVKNEPTMKERKRLRKEKQLEKQGKKTRIIST